MTNSTTFRPAWASVTLCIFFLASVFHASAQNSSQQAIDDLKKKVSRLRSEISIKQDSLNKAWEELDRLEKKQIASKYYREITDTFIPAKVKRDGKVFRQPEWSSTVVGEVKPGDIVKLLDYTGHYWLISKEDASGYVMDIMIDENEEARKYKSAIEKKTKDAAINAELEKMAAEKQASDKLKKQTEKEIEEWKKGVIAKYGNKVGQKLVDGYYWVGMTAEMARVSLGEPETINKSVGTWGVHEQWVYGSIYLYIEKGKVASYQNSQ